jgi:hypothetical protein
MSNKQKRLQEVYDHLRRWYGIHTQTDFANSMRYSRNAISLALNGNEKYLTEKLFRSVCETYPGIFNLDYLLTGNGTLLKERVIHDDGLIMATERDIDASSLVNAALAAKDETIAVMREQIEAKDALIASLRQQIELLKQTTADHSPNTPFMVAENPKV